MYVKFLNADVHVILVIKAEETYENIAAQWMKKSLSNINSLIKDPHITIDNETYEVETFLCCDYKVINYIHTNTACMYLIVMYICDWACENRPCEHKLKFSAEQKQIFMLFKLYIPHNTSTLWASCWRFIATCDAL